MFPCSECGLCCQNIAGIEELKSFDLGNGVCKHYDTITKKCNIYDTRPEICNIEKMFETKYKQFFSKEEFFIENAKVCNLLQEKYKLDKSFRVIIGDM